MNQLILRHGGTATRYNMVDGGFDFTAGAKLHLSVEAEIADAADDEAPRELFVGIINSDFSRPAEPIRVTDKHDAWGGDDGLPHAFVYTGFHHQIVAAQVVVLSYDDNEMKIDLTVSTDDVEFYDVRAGKDAVSGHLVLERTTKDKLWRP